MRRTLFLFIFLIVVVIMGCDTKKENINGYELQSAKALTNEDWDRLATLKIYFGHQSVGFNILDGIRDVMNEYKPGKLTIEESLTMLKSSKPGIAHTTIGNNTEPIKKIDDFAGKINEINGNVDIAFLKLCYVDITEPTDITKVFNHYKNTMDTLKRTYPDVTFIHFTTPLTVDKKGLKASIKRLLGKRVGGYEDNVARYKYNKMIKDEYGGKEPVFDLAAIESTDTDGRQTLKVLKGNEYTSLIESYTSDGGHLNESGRKVVAEQLLIYILQLKK